MTAMNKAWPLPALLVWAAAWALFAVLGLMGLPAVAALLLATLAGGLLALAGNTPWRRVFIAAGFPLSMALSGGLAPSAAVGLPGWVWLAALGLLLLLYPVGSWRDAPLFPTPTGALRGLAAVVPLPPGARVVDAGCGLGAGLVELHRAYPQAQLEGLEWSWPLSLACRLRCRFATVRRADIWAVDWSAYRLVYLFQRPESMPRALQKACNEMAPGSWLVSLEFVLDGVTPQHRLQADGGKPVWVYQLPLRVRGGGRPPG